MSLLDLRWRKKPKPTPPPVVPPPAVPPPTLPPVGPSQPIRVTSEIDGQILNREYPYWPHAYVEPAGTVLCFVGHADGRPRFFRVDLASQHSQRLGPLLNYRGTGEGWYLSADGSVSLCDGPRLRRILNPSTGADMELIALDISETHPNCRLWQAHSDDAGLCHSATVERITSDGPYERLGTVVQRHGAVRFIGRNGVLDESQVDASGQFLVIKENEDNRVIDLVSDLEYPIANINGAFGHSDCGAGFIVGENDILGHCEWMDLRTQDRRVLMADIWNLGHVSVRGNRCLLSDATHLNLSLLALDGSGPTVLFHHGINAHGDYDKQVRAALSPCGTVASYVADGALYLLRVP